MAYSGCVCGTDARGVCIAQVAVGVARWNDFCRNDANVVEARPREETNYQCSADAASERRRADNEAAAVARQLEQRANEAQRRVDEQLQQVAACPVDDPCCALDRVCMAVGCGARCAR